MNELIQQILGHPFSSFVVILNLIVIESLLSVDNAAVLALMVLDLSREQRAKSLRYGIIGGYVFRGLALIFASYLMRFWFLKALGGLYLIFLFYDWIRKKRKESVTEKQGIKERSRLFKIISSRIGQFWTTVIMIEIMDMAFSVDNVFAAVAFTKNIILVWVGVFIGMLAMRFVSQAFVRAMERFVFLESSAFVVIGLLGIKLVLSLCGHFAAGSAISRFLASQASDWVTSALTILIFTVPVLVSLGSKSLATKKRNEREN